MMLEDDGFDALIANVGEDWVLGRPDAIERMAHLVDRFAAIGVKSTKPMAFVLGPADSMDETKWRAVSGGQQRLTDARLAVYPSVDRAASAVARFLARATVTRRTKDGEPRTLESAIGPRHPSAFALTHAGTRDLEVRVDLGSVGQPMIGTGSVMLIASGATTGVPAPLAGAPANERRRRSIPRSAC